MKEYIDLVTLTKLCNELTQQYCFSWVASSREQTLLCDSFMYVQSKNTCYISYRRNPFVLNLNYDYTIKGFIIVLMHSQSTNVMLMLHDDSIFYPLFFLCAII